LQLFKGMYKTGIFILSLLLFSLSADAQAPTVHAKSISSSNVYCHSLTLTWSNGNGDGRVVVAKEGSTVDSVPLDDKYYPGDFNFGDGEELGTGNFALYSGTGNSVDITGLKKNTTYYFAVYEYNISSPDVDYLTVTGFAQYNVTTENIVSAFSIDNTYQCLMGNQIQLNASSSNSLGNSMTYTFDFGDKNTAIGKTQTYSYLKGGIFKISLTTESTGCKDVLVLPDTVVIPYVTTFALDNSIPGNDSVQCFIGNHFRFENNSYRPNSPVYGLYDATNFRWFHNGVQKGTSQHHNIKFDTPGIYKIKLITERRVKPDGKAVRCKDSFESTYVVLPEPLQPGDVLFMDTLCLGADNFEFEHLSTTAVSQRWHFGDGDSSDSNPAMHTYGQVGEFKFILTVTDDSGCVSTFVDTVEVISIPNNFFSGLDAEYCKGDPKVFMQPNIGGGMFDGLNVNPFDSSFTPSNVGVFEVDYILQVGNCLDTANIQVTVLNVPSFSLGRDTTICEGSNFQIDPQMPGFTYKWNDGSTAQTKTVNQKGLYWLEATDVKCRFRDSILISTIKAPDFEFGKDTTLCGGEVLRLNAYTPMSSYQWNDFSGDSIRDISQSGFYKVTVTNKCGTHSDSIRIEILPFACEIYIPNAFSPNNDELNGTFFPQGYFDFTSMEIYNRWGELLYYTEELNKGWDGTFQGAEAQLGVYFFVIRYELPDEEGRLTKKRASGTVFLVR
jgi:gliding motility-associated-like protein